MIRNAVKTWSLLLLFALAGMELTYPQSVPEPDLPAEPKNPSVEEKRDARGESKNSVTNEFAITAVFCDAREVAGKWQSGEKEFTFSHVRDGISYSKTLKLSDIRLVRIVSWKLHKERPGKEGDTYRIFPYEVVITDAESVEYRKFSLKGSGFLEMPLENRFGKTRLFSYWMDFLGTDGKWHTGMPAIQGEIRNDCHKDVVKEIRFKQKNPEE